MGSGADPPTAAFRGPSLARLAAGLVPTLGVNGVLPVVLYQLLKSRGVADVPALVAGSAFPIASGLWGWARARRLELMAAISLAFIIVSAASSLITASPRFALIKESFLTGTFGLIFFGSLLASRPVMFHLAGTFATGGDPERRRVWNGLWRYPGFRHAMRVMTAIWGATFVADALIRTALVFVLSTSVFLVVSRLLFYGMFAATFALTMAYGRRTQRKGEEEGSVR